MDFFLSVLLPPGDRDMPLTLQLLMVTRLESERITKQRFILMPRLVDRENDFSLASLLFLKNKLNFRLFFLFSELARV